MFSFIFSTALIVRAGFVQMLEKSEKVWNSNCKFSRSGKSWKMTLGMEKFGKSHGKCEG